MEDLLQGKLTDEELIEMFKMNPNLEKVTTRIPLDLNRHSFIANGESCLPACCAIAACYWKDLMPDLKLSLNKDYWYDFINKTSHGTIKGVNLAKIRANLRQEERNILKFSEKTLKSFSDLIPPFNLRFPFIQIALFDRMFSFREISGSGHSVIISQVNMKEKNLLVIDPTLYNDDKIIIESHIHMDEFAKGWKLFSNLVIWVYPKLLLKSFNIKNSKANVRKNLTQQTIFKYIKEVKK